MILDVPEVIQPDEYSCGVAVYEAVLRYYRIPGAGPPHADPHQGLSPDALEAALRRSGLRVVAGECEDATDLVHHLGRGRPVICLVSRDGVGHYVVVRGIGVGRGLGPVYLMDPADGRVKMSRRAFETGWQDVSRWGVSYRRYALAVWQG